MLAALLINLPQALPPTPHQHARGGGGSGHRRRPNEPVIWCDDDNIKCQDELTAFKAKPEDEQKAIVLDAMDAIKKASPTTELIIEAQYAVEEFARLDDMLCQAECLNMLLLAYYRLCFIRKREQNDIAAMLLLGIL